MSRNALILEKETPDKSPQVKWRRAEFRGLIHRLFHDNAAAALIGPDADSRTSEVCWGLAKELAADGHRVVIVDVERTLRADALPPVTACSPGGAANISFWPAIAEDALEPSHFDSSSLADSDWISSLRHAFDAVLLNCPSLETEPEAAEIAARADAAVLVVQAGQTKKKQILQEERALERRGAKLAGCILMRRR